MNYYNKYFDGIFWLPKNPKRRIIATLYIDDEGIATISSLQPLETDKKGPNSWPSFDLVCGYLNSHIESKAHSIKLYQAYKSFQSEGPISKFKYTSKNSIISSGIDRNINHRSYDALMFNSELVDTWIPDSGFEFKSSMDEEFAVRHIYKLPDRIDLYSDKDFIIYIFFRASSRLTKRRNSTINEKVFINIETPKPFKFDEFPPIKKSLERLFSLLLFKPFLFSLTELKSTNNVNYKVIKKSSELNSNENA